MKIDILTLFPDMFQGFLQTSIIKRSLAKKVVSVNLVNIRDFTLDKYGRVDDYPVGGGAGLVMKSQPIVASIKQVKTTKSKVILLSPRGESFNQDMAQKLSKEEHLIFVCGHYEGVDERINDHIDQMISLGDFILTGGELAAMVVADSLIRLLPGAISEGSLDNESFNQNLLEHPHYTLPREFENKKIPPILFSGNHQAIRKYRLKESLRLTLKYRQDLLKNTVFTKEEIALLKEIDEKKDDPKWMLDALEKGKKFMD